MSDVIMGFKIYNFLITPLECKQHEVIKFNACVRTKSSTRADSVTIQPVPSHYWHLSPCRFYNSSAYL